MSAPRKGKEVKHPYGIRLEPTLKNNLVAKFGTLQAAIDKLTKRFR